MVNIITHNTFFRVRVRARVSPISENFFDFVFVLSFLCYEL